MIGAPAESKPRPKQLKHAQACMQCSRGKVRCDGRRPCGRCVQRGLSSACCGRQATFVPHSAPHSEELTGYRMSKANGLSSTGAATSQQSAVVNLLSQGSAAFALDDSVAAGGDGVVGDLMRVSSGEVLSMPLLQPLGSGSDASHTGVPPWQRGEQQRLSSETRPGMDSAALPATPALSNMDSILDHVSPPIRSPIVTSQSSLARTPGSGRDLGHFSRDSSSSSLGSISDFFSLADSGPGLGLYSLGNASSSLVGSGTGAVGVEPGCRPQQGAVIPAPVRGPSFDSDRHSEASQLPSSAPLAERSCLGGVASHDQPRGSGLGLRRCLAMSDLYSDSDQGNARRECSDQGNADAAGAAAMVSDSGPLIFEVDVTLRNVGAACRLRRLVEMSWYDLQEGFRV